MSKKVIIGVIVLILLGGGAYFFLRQGNTNANTTSVSKDSHKPATATIVYSDGGFSPATTTVKSGDTVAIKNDSSKSLEFDSDPHPIHTDDPELNVGAVKPGDTMTFTVSKQGDYGYHNHLNPRDQGTIVVQ